MTLDPSTEIHASDRYFTSHQVGDILQVNPSSVVKWINDGILNAFRTPGGHRRVSASELVRFARHHGMPVPNELRDLALTKVLVVDDEPRFLASLQRAFKPYAEEIALQTTENGIEALVATGSFKPDVLILDLHMPTVDGFKVLERLKAYPETSHTVVIVMSGQMDEATVERCKKLGAMACLSKPVKIPELLETLREFRRPRYQWSR
ncbi:MAG: response regulator [Myxococcales bacterium]